jgi:hypothetical protein
VRPVPVVRVVRVSRDVTGSCRSVVSCCCRRSRAPVVVRLVGPLLS